MTAEEEGEPRSEGVHIHSGLNGCLNVGDAVGQGEGDLLDGGATSFPHMVATDADGIPMGEVIFAEGEDIRYDPHGFLGREDIGSPGHVFLEDLVLRRTPEGLGFHTLLFGHGDIHGQKDGCRGIDSHGRGDPVQGDFLENGLHIRQGINGYANLSHFTYAQGMIGIVPDLGGEVEGHTEARLTVVHEISVPLVGLLRRPETGQLPECPAASPVHRGVNSANKRFLTRQS